MLIVLKLGLLDFLTNNSGVHGAVLCALVVINEVTLRRARLVLGYRAGE